MVEIKMESVKKTISWKVVICRRNPVEKGRKRKEEESRKEKPKVVGKDSTKVKYSKVDQRKNETRTIDFKNG